MINLKYWRTKRRLTQLQLATLIETTPGYIHEIENGKKCPSIKMLYKIADALCICPKDLLICYCKKCINKKTKAITKE